MNKVVGQPQGKNMNYGKPYFSSSLQGTNRGETVPKFVIGQKMKTKMSKVKSSSNFL